LSPAIKVAECAHRAEDIDGPGDHVFVAGLYNSVVASPMLFSS
jgi:hypothetical protein